MENRTEVSAAVIDPREIAEVMNSGLNQVYAALRRGEIPHKRIGRRYIIPRTRFFEWLQEC